MTEQLKALPWTLIRSKTTFKDRWLTLRSDECETPSGQHIPSYHVVEYPDWINVVAVTDEGKLLLVREYRHGRGEVVTGLVSGTIDAGDGAAGNRALTAAKRELTEETGYGGGRFTEILCVYPNPATQNNLTTSFLATGLKRIAETKFDATEAIDLLVEDFADVLRGLRSGAITMQALHVAALWTAASIIAADRDNRLVDARLRDAIIRAFTGP